MMDQELKKLIKQAKMPEIDQNRKRQDIDKVCESLNAHQALVKIPWISQMLRVGTYISPFIWLAQGFILLFFGWIVFVGGEQDAAMPLTIAMVLAPILGGISTLELIRGYSCGMWELEKVCRYDLRMIQMMKLELIGTGDLLILAVLTAVTASYTNSLSLSILTILIPFNLSNAVYLTVIRKMPRKVSGYLLTAVSVVLGVVLAGSWQNMGFQGKRLIEENSLGIWIALLLSLALLILSAIRMINSTKKEDLLSWNCD